MVPEVHSVVVEEHLWIEVEVEDRLQDKTEARCSFAMEAVAAVVRAGHVALSMHFLLWRIE